MTDQEHLLRPGDKVGEEYEVLEFLGAGGFAQVYKCRGIKLGQTVAVKVIIEKRLREDALQEARTVVELKHNRIVRVLNVGSLPSGESYIVMDYVEGQNLEEMLDAETPLRQLPLNEETLQIVTDVAKALDFAHAHKIIHRDIKPSNIIVDASGRAHLTDFGLADVKLLRGMSVKTLDDRNSLSGTIPYMSPEQADEERLRPASDQYSLGVVVYEMLTGQLPHRGRTTGLLVRILRDDPIPPRQLNTNCLIKHRIF